MLSVSKASLGLKPHSRKPKCCGLNCVPQKECVSPNPQAPVDMTSFGNKVFADVISSEEVLLDEGGP